MNQWWEEEEVSVSDAAIGCQKDHYHNPYMFYFSNVYIRDAGPGGKNEG